MLLYEKYAPSSLNGIIGNASAIAAVKQFGLSVLAGKLPRPLLLYGPSGVGKTTAATLLASTYGFGLVLLTASDYRDAETLKKKLLPAVSLRGLFNRVNLIVFDEIDELSSQFDKGAQAIILQIVQSSKQPIIFIANDYWDQHIAFLRNYVDKVEFKAVSQAELLSFLKSVVSKEGASVDEGVLRKIAESSNGDVRGALNDLEFVLGSKNSELIESLGIRNHKMEIFKVLDSIFLTKSFDFARRAFDSSDLDLDLLLKWVDENIPNRYAAMKSILNAYDFLATASKLYNKAARINYYGLIKYASILASSGVSIANEGYVKRLSPYAFPKQVKYLSSTKGERNTAMLIAAKLAKHMHTSRKDILFGFVPILKIMLAEEAKKLGSDQVAGLLAKEFEFDKGEIDLLLNNLKT